MKTSVSKYLAEIGRRGGSAKSDAKAAAAKANGKRGGRPKCTAKCVHCGKPTTDHLAANLACPVGTKHRTIGYTQYHSHHHYEAKASLSRRRNDNTKPRKR